MTVRDVLTGTRQSNDGLVTADADFRATADDPLDHDDTGRGILLINGRSELG